MSSYDMEDTTGSRADRIVLTADKSRAQNRTNGAVLSYASRELEQLPPEISLDPAFSSCTELYLDYNALSSLPESLPSNLPKLAKLSVIGNDLTSLPSTLGQLSGLRELYLNENNFKLLPESTTKLSNLTVLQVVGNKLTCLPVEFGHLKNLVKLRADENKLKHLPESFGLLRNVQTIELSHNCLSSLPQAFGQLERLRRLDLSENKLDSLLASFSKLPSLVLLDLSENNLKSLPNRLDSCDILTKLYLDCNLLDTLPPWFADLSCIMELSLRDNQLREAALPENFGNTSQLLRHLDLSGNFMTKLPEAIGE